jgi:hypothetical protein
MDGNNEMSRKKVLEVLSATPAERLPLPLAYADPAFNKCMLESFASHELIEQFDRLTGCKVGRIGHGPEIVRMIDEATGFQDDQLRQFADFVHRDVYMRLAPEAIHALRLV